MRRTSLTTAAFLASLIAAALLPADGRAAEGLPAPAFQEWQVWEVKTGRLLSFDELAAALTPLDVIYIGEEHHNARHIEAALKILTALVNQGRHPTLAMEMFGWDGQGALDHYLADKGWERQAFLQDVRWEANWGGAFDDYEPLPAFARAHHLPLVALNPPKSLVRLVAKRGLAQAMTDPEMARWGMSGEVFVDDVAYRDMIVAPLRQCHGGLTDEAYQRMYEASMFRDEGMAKTIADILRRAQAGSAQEPRRGVGPVVSYTGGGHVQYKLPVPNRVLRRQGDSVKQATIYLTSFEPSRTDELHRLMEEDVADYLWLTPVGANGPPKRCK